MSNWQMFGVWYAACTIVYCAMQAVENRRFGRSGDFYAPVWWIALTWPFWVLMIALDVPKDWAWRYGPKRKARNTQL